jgi:integrase
MARGKAGSAGRKGGAPARGKRLPLLVIVMHGKPMRRSPVNAARQRNRRGSRFHPGHGSHPRILLASAVVKLFRKWGNSEELSEDVMKAAANLRVVDDTGLSRVFGRVPPLKPKNEDRRPREHLTEVEVEALAKAAGKRGRYGHRDRTMIMVCFRHGLHVGELVSLRWDQINLDEALIAVRRDKKGRNTEHPIPGEELRAFRAC